MSVNDLENTLRNERQARPRAAEVRSRLPEHAPERSTTKGLFLFLVSIVPYLAAYSLALFGRHWGLQLLGALLTGIFIAVCFVVGHDACHGSLTRSGFLNRLIARLCFLPSLHSYTAWDLGHNQLHHGWTNLRGMDYVWTPFTKAEFDQLSSGRKMLERFYRTSLGLGFYYFIEIWWKQGVAPNDGAMTKLKGNVEARNDLLLVVAFFTLQLALPLFFVLSNGGSALSVGAITALYLKLVGYSVVLPFLLWNWFMGLAIYLHHTHPAVIWYDSKKEWDFYRGQVEGTVHVELPAFLDPLFHHIMVHTAHHVNPRIPSYNLQESQASLNAAYGEDMHHWTWNFSTFFDALRRCKLYDYQNRVWLGFDGKPSK